MHPRTRPNLFVEATPAWTRGFCTIATTATWAAKNYNRVFEGCDTEYFKWAASDDLCDPSYLSRCVEVLDREPDVILCYGKTKIIDANGDVIDCYEDGLNLISSSAGGRYLQLKYNLGKCNALCGVIRSDVLRSTRLIGNFIGSDECLLAELALLGKFREHPEYLFLRRDHPGSSSANKDIASQLQFFDPSLNGKIVLREWRHLFENLMSIRRTPVRLSQKVEPMFFLLGSSLINGKQYLRELTVALKQFVKSRNTKPRQNGN